MTGSRWKCQVCPSNKNATECGVYTIARIRSLIDTWDNVEDLICDKNMKRLRSLFTKELENQRIESVKPHL
jgi:Ulp1 family protease